MTQLSTWAPPASPCIRARTSAMRATTMLRHCSACELYTDRFAESYGGAQADAVFDTYLQAARRAQTLGLGVNAGHDLDLRNLARFLDIPGILEVSIGHALVAEFDAVSREHPAQDGRVVAFLSSHFHAAEAASVFFMASRALAYALTPATLATCWPCLLAISDEGPLLYQPAMGKFVWCRPQGALAGGEDGRAPSP